MKQVDTSSYTTSWDTTFDRAHDPEPIATDNDEEAIRLPCGFSRKNVSFEQLNLTGR
jgi:hypothetical protein